ncbi:hypothetical protein BBJ28_00023112 [Nothophytophthora sp. Chile5]|nr:hypothetical protein BBJ28_00023112 [Nothophytophthora sp. Chile5]
MASAAPRSPLATCDLVGALEPASLVDVGLAAPKTAGCGTEAKTETKAEAKKRRHRENMARGRSRKDALMDTMRQQYHHLSQKLETGMEVWHRRRRVAVGARHYSTREASSDEDGGYTSASSSSTTATTVSSTQRSQLATKYVDAVATENAIHRENETLAQRLELLEIFEAALLVDTQTLADQQRSQGPELLPRTSNAINRPGYWSYFAEDTEPFYYEPMPTIACHDLIRGKYQTIRAHHAMFTTRQQTTERVQFFGWTVQRSLSDRRKFEFHFVKRFPCADSTVLADELAREGWRIFNTPDLYKRLYRSAVDVRVLQRVDPFNTILMRNSPDANRSHRFRHLNLMSKVGGVNQQGQRSLSILTLVLPPPDDLANTNKDGVVYLRDAYTYIRFDMCAGHVQLTYGGHGDCLNEAQARFLFVETGNVLFRFEQMVRPSNLVTLS